MTEEGRKSGSFRPLVMVVDDVDDIRSVLHLWLERPGYDVLEAEGGRHAVELAQSVRPTLILMDISMPGGDGLNATRLLREHAHLRDVPIIVISANETKYYRAAAYAAGCTAYLVKPIDPYELESLLGAVIARK